jgi:hypothetical protein
LVQNVWRDRRPGLQVLKLQLQPFVKLDCLPHAFVFGCKILDDLIHEQIRFHEVARVSPIHFRGAGFVEAFENLQHGDSVGIPATNHKSGVIAVRYESAEPFRYSAEKLSHASVYFDNRAGDGVHADGV